MYLFFKDGNNQPLMLDNQPLMLDGTSYEYGENKCTEFKVVKKTLKWILLKKGQWPVCDQRSLNGDGGLYSFS